MLLTIGNANAITLYQDGSIVTDGGTFIRCSGGKLPVKGVCEADEQNVTLNKTKKKQKIVTEIPDWCLSLPESNVAIYTCGIGQSKNLNMARSRATLEAKRLLADQIDSEISSRMENFIESTGSGDDEQIIQRSVIVTKNVTNAARLTGYKQVFSSSQNVGDLFIHFILIGYPIGEANQALVSQIKEDELLSTTEAAEAAIAELEAEIMKKYSGS